MPFGILVQGPPLSLKIPPQGREVEKSKPDSYLCNDPEELISYAKQDWGCLFVFGWVNHIWNRKVYHLGNVFKRPGLAESCPKGEFCF